MHCCLWFRSVFRVRGPWPKRYGYHLSIILLFHGCGQVRVCISNFVWKAASWDFVSVCCLEQRGKDVVASRRLI